MNRSLVTLVMFGMLAAGTARAGILSDTICKNPGKYPAASSDKDCAPGMGFARVFCDQERPREALARCVPQDLIDRHQGKGGDASRASSVASGPSGYAGSRNAIDRRLDCALPTRTGGQSPLAACADGTEVRQVACGIGNTTKRPVCGDGRAVNNADSAMQRCLVLLTSDSNVSPEGTIYLDHARASTQTRVVKGEDEYGDETQAYSGKPATQQGSYSLTHDGHIYYHACAGRTPNRRYTFPTGTNGPEGATSVKLGKPSSTSATWGSTHTSQAEECRGERADGPEARQVIRQALVHALDTDGIAGDFAPTAGNGKKGYWTRRRDKIEACQSLLRKFPRDVDSQLMTNLAGTLNTIDRWASQSANGAASSGGSTAGSAKSP